MTSENSNERLNGMSLTPDADIKMMNGIVIGNRRHGSGVAAAPE
jgi:hypothetical protein